jgi:hypothetical protein
MDARLLIPETLSELILAAEQGVELAGGIVKLRLSVS